jgi:hypothetical protein
VEGFLDSRNGISRRRIEEEDVAVERIGPNLSREIRNGYKTRNKKTMRGVVVEKSMGWSS